MGFPLDGRRQCGYEYRALTVDVGMKHGPDKWLSPCLYSRCQAIVSANVRADPIKCPKFRGASVVPLVDSDHWWGSRRGIPELPGFGAADGGVLHPPEAAQAADAVPVCRALGLRPPVVASVALAAPPFSAAPRPTRSPSSVFGSRPPPRQV